MNKRQIHYPEQPTKRPVGPAPDPIILDTNNYNGYNRGMEMKKYLLTMEPEEHKFIRKLAAELELSIKDVLLQGIQVLAEQHPRTRSAKPGEVKDE